MEFPPIPTHHSPLTNHPQHSQSAHSRPKRQATTTYLPSHHSQSAHSPSVKLQLPTFLPVTMSGNEPEAETVPGKELSTSEKEARLLLAMAAKLSAIYVDQHNLFGVSPDNPLGSPDITKDTDGDLDISLDDEESLDGRQLVKEFDKVHATKPRTVKKKSASEKNGLQRRGSSFSAEEALMVSKAVMKSSQDRIKGTDKKGEVLWDQVWKTYSVLLKQYNILYSKKQPDKFRPFNSRTKASVKNQWNGKIQPCINKFASLVATNQPKSGYVEDDAWMDLYWGEMHQPATVASKSIVAFSIEY